MDNPSGDNRTVKFQYDWDTVFCFILNLADSTDISSALQLTALTVLSLQAIRTAEEYLNIKNKRIIEYHKLRFEN